MSLDGLSLDKVLEETATLYEAVASLPTVVDRIGGAGHGKPGSRLPPGMNDLLDIDEYQRAVEAVDEWALFIAHVLVDEVDGIGSVPHSTPGRLRLSARWADHFERHNDAHLRYSVGLDARDHLSTMRRLSKRGTRTVRTASLCMDTSCRGEYVATIKGPEVDGDLVCSTCASRVPRDQWERWGARAEWITPQRAANLLGISLQAVWQRASREGWRRMGSRKTTKYHSDDVSATLSGIQGTSVS